MFKQISKIKFYLLRLLEKELLTVLAICVVALGGWLVRADTDTTLLSFVITDGGTITVTAPNGAENWQVDSPQNITWTTTGSIANVKIELQRTTGGSWEELTASTTNDGDFPWVTTSPTSTTATVRISSVTVPAITDSSDAVFIISAAPAGSSGGYVPTYPMIDSVNPMSFYYDVGTELIIRGLGFEDRAWATLNQVVFPVQKPHDQNLMTMNLLPNTLTQGTYRLCVYNTFWQYDCYRNLITVTDKTKVTPPTTGGVGEEYSATLVGQSLNPTLKPRETATVWVEYQNTGTATWYQDGKNPVRLGTDNKRDRKSGFYHPSWIKYNRPILVNRIVKSGEIGRFEFIIQAPWTGKTYTEYFKPVAEYKTWIDGKSQVKWVITVQKQSFWDTFKKTVIQPIIKPVPKPTIPSTGGKIDQPFQPGDMLMFSDRIEQIYQGAVKLFNNIFTKLRK